MVNDSKDPLAGAVSAVCAPSKLTLAGRPVAQFNVAGATAAEVQRELLCLQKALETEKTGHALARYEAMIWWEALQRVRRAKASMVCPNCKAAVLAQREPLPAEAHELPDLSDLNTDAHLTKWTWPEVIMAAIVVALVLSVIIAAIGRVVKP